MSSFLDKLTDALFTEKRSVFLTGQGGTGKSYLIRQLSDIATRKNINMYVTATTGIAALNVGGTTFHRWAGIGMGFEDAEQLFIKILSRPKSLMKWRSTQVLVIDEISMFGAELFQKMDAVAKKIKGNKLPWGGIRLLCVGDMLQLPPVKAEWIYNCAAWQDIDFKIFLLKKPKRFVDKAWFHLLSRIRYGEHTDNDTNILTQKHERYQAENDIIQEKKKQMRTSNNIKEWYILPTILYSRKIDVLKENMFELNQIESESEFFHAEDKFLKKGKYKGEVSNFKALLDDSIPEIVELKVGAQVMLKMNLDPEQGLVNGSRGVVKKFIAYDDGHKDVTVDFTTQKNVVVSNQVFQACEGKTIVGRSQIPLILAYSLTIHKCQGSTLDTAVVDLGGSVFAPGQAYVALSRCKNLDGLYIKNFSPNAIIVDRESLLFMKEIEV